MSKTNIQNIDNVTFGNAIIETTLNTGFDGDAPDELKREVSLIFELSDHEKVTQYCMDRLAAALRIKVNQDDGFLKGASGVGSYETYAEMLDNNDCEFHFTEQDLIDLLTPSKRTSQKEMSQQEMIDYWLKIGKIDEEQHAQMSSIAEEG